jgi:hypothetical protein
VQQDVTARPHARNGPVLALALLAAAAAVGLEAYPLTHPQFVFDDLSIVLHSWTWEKTCANLWVPDNEHTKPLGRLSTWLLTQLAGRVTAVPLALALQGPLALVAAMGLVYLFVRRELGHPFYGLFAMSLFGVTAVYQQVVCWFAASFAVLALDMMLLALLAAQRYRQTGRGRYLFGCAAATALALTWFASGILAGPLCCLYLLCPGEHKESTAPGSLARRLAVALTPLAGTALFLAVSLPLNGRQILHTPHYGEKGALGAFHPLIGLEYTYRSLADNLLLGLVGVVGVTLPLGVVSLLVAGLVVAAVWWWRRAPARQLLVLGLGFILSSYLLIFSARAEWSYEGYMTAYNFSRYHLLPQLGLTLFVCGGLPAEAGRSFSLLPSGRLTRRQIQGLLGLIGLLFVIQLPRSVAAPPRYEPEQQVVLRRIEELEARCLAHHVSGDTARQVLTPARLEVPLCGDEENGWDLIRGSDTPRPISPDEARRILEAP